MSSQAKRGILLAAFGSANRVGAKALNCFAEQARMCLPDIPILCAYTSPHMRDRLASAGKKTDSVQKSSLRMGFDRYTHFVVLSLHLLLREESDALVH